MEVETTDKDLEKNIKRDMDEMKKLYETVNDKIWNLETRKDTMSRDQAESLCVIQLKLDALLTNSITQEKTSEKQAGTREDFVEPQRKKQESIPFPQIHNSIGSG